ncbi:MAG: hypothetical protein LWW77_01630 [Propionibacteriales bacterium]|nr:hypothetical protein [Propionibacteriales bacterium]
MSGEPFDDFQIVENPLPITIAPAGGWLSLWQPRHTVAALAVLPGLFAINFLIADAPRTILPVALVALVATAQAVVAGSFLPQKERTTIVTCGMIPPATLIASTVLLSEMPVDITFGFLALALAATGVAFRFFATTCAVD